MTEKELNGQTYRIGKMPAMQQMHVSRRLAPLVPTLVPAFLKVARQGNMLADVEGTAALLLPFAEALADMKDADAEYVYRECLGVVQRRTTPTTWAPVWDRAAASVMFDDMDVGTLTVLVLEVVVDSLGPFIRGLLTGQPEASPNSAAG